MAGLGLELGLDGWYRSLLVSSDRVASASEEEYARLGSRTNDFGAWVVEEEEKCPEDVLGDINGSEGCDAPEHSAILD